MARAVESTRRAPALPRKQSRVVALLYLARQKPLGVVGLLLLLTSTLVAIFAPWIAPYDPDILHRGARLLFPSSTHWFGTDHLGQDVFSRVVFGARISLFVGLSVVLVGSTVGTTVGVLSGYWGGRLDLIVQRFVDSIAAFPALVLALALVAVMGRSLTSVIVALAVVSIPTVTRTVRSAALSVREAQYVEAARAVGASDGRIILRHILPNCMAPVIILASAYLGTAIVSEATLSFLGVGTPVNIPSWGGMLSGRAQQLAPMAPWIAIFPGIALSVTVLGINLFGDALRDVLDPRLRRQ